MRTFGSLALLYFAAALVGLGCDEDKYKSKYEDGALINKGDWVKHKPTGNIGVVYSNNSRKLVDDKWVDRIAVELHDGRKYVAGFYLYKSAELVKIEKPDSIVSSDRVKIPFKPE